MERDAIVQTIFNNLPPMYATDEEDRSLEWHEVDESWREGIERAAEQIVESWPTEDERLVSAETRVKELRDEREVTRKLLVAAADLLTSATGDGSGVEWTERRDRWLRLRGRAGV